MKSTQISVAVAFLFLAFGENVLSSFNINQQLFQFILVVLSLVSVMDQWKTLRMDKSYVALISFLFVFSAYKLLTDTGEGSRILLMTIVSAPIILNAFPPIESCGLRIRNQVLWRQVFRLFIIFFLIETLMAIFERVSGKMVFGWASLSSMSQFSNVMEYRSTALYGHPLYNALMVSTAMTFFLTSALRPKYKFLLWGIGFGALLCFNTRGSIVGNSLILGLYMFHTILLNRRVSNSTKTSLLLAASAVAFFGYLALTTGTVGGRLLTMGLFDESSAQVRVDAMDFIISKGFTTFLIGMSYKSYTNYLFANHIAALENFWLEYLMRFGLIFLIGYVLFYFLFLKREMRNYKLFDKLLISGTFILIASTNNSLSTSFIALLYFLILIRLFNPASFRKIVNKKYHI